MKKIFIVASVLLMCCMFMGCGVKAKLDGTWKSNNVHTNEIDEDVTRTDTLNITLTINKDGTFAQESVYSVSYNSDSYEGWTETEKLSGTWYYHDSDKVILKITHYEIKEDGDDEVYEVNEPIYSSSEIVLVDDILFAEIETELCEGIYEFTKAE
ncbi:MAG: hypothetical protein IJ361_08410 [Spirochaetaceae bacterium]|nr:hypothetical protein [Spirochaetaceae bacterium]